MIKFLEKENLDDDKEYLGERENNELLAMEL